MFKNRAGQKIRILVIDTVEDTPIEGQAAFISCKISKDYGARVDLASATVTELEDGFYHMDLSQEETNADFIEFFPETSVTNHVAIIPASSFDGHTRIYPTTTVDVDSDPTFTETADNVGPKRVKTKEYEVEAHDAMTLEKINERRRAFKPVVFSGFNSQQVRHIDDNCPKRREE